MALEFPYTDKINNKTHETYYHFMHYLRCHTDFTTKSYYDTFHKKEGEGICKCGKPIKWRSGGYGKWCSRTCHKLVEKRTQVVKEFYQSEDIEEKIKLRTIRRGKVDNNVAKARVTREKTALSLGFNSLHEYDSFLGKEKIKNVSPEEMEKRTIKAMQTKAKNNNYGGKSNYKPYMLFGTEIKVQGYEDLVLDYLQERFDENELKAGGKTLGYINYYDKELKNRLYFPDAIIPNFIVEVKSEYTFKHQKRNVYEKIGGCFNENKNIIIIIPSKKEARKGKLESSKKLLDWAISSQASNHKEPFVLMYDEGSTTILYGVESSDSKRRGSCRNLQEHDIVWTELKNSDG